MGCMVRKIILILSLFLPLLVFSQEDFDEESAQEIPIGSSGIDLAPEEEISTPTVSEPAPAQTESAPTSEPTPAPTESAPAPESPPADSQPPVGQ